MREKTILDHEDIKTDLSGDLQNFAEESFYSLKNTINNASVTMLLAGSAITGAAVLYFNTQTGLDIPSVVENASAMVLGAKALAITGALTLAVGAKDYLTSKKTYDELNNSGEGGLIKAYEKSQELSVMDRMHNGLENYIQTFSRVPEDSKTLGQIKESQNAFKEAKNEDVMRTMEKEGYIDFKDFTKEMNTRVIESYNKSLINGSISGALTVGLISMAVQAEGVMNPLLSNVSNYDMNGLIGGAALASVVAIKYFKDAYQNFKKIDVDVEDLANKYKADGGLKVEIDKPKKVELDPSKKETLDESKYLEIIRESLNKEKPTVSKPYTTAVKLKN